MKKIFTLFSGLVLFFILVNDNLFNNNILNLIEKNYYKNNNENYHIVSNVEALNSNKYFKENLSDYVSITNNFYPKNKKELLNVYYTVLNNGWDKFSYYCDKSYTNCLKDIESLSNDNKELSFVNQLLNPYNSFSSIISNYNTGGRIDIEVKRKYTNKEIKKIDNELNNIINKLNINNIDSLKEKIRVFHDYIATINVYDSDKENGKSNYNSDKAIGTLFEGHSICSGYTDTLSLFLDKINLKNYKIANDEHTWNVVLINGDWYHIDLTWDDPITNTGENIIQYNYFLITTPELESKNEIEHNYSKEIYNFIK